MRTFFLASLALMGSTAFGQSDWRPTNTSPMMLALRAQAVMASFAGVDGAVSTNLFMPEGKGAGRCNPQFRSTKVFQLDYPVITRQLKRVAYPEEWIRADGSGRMLRLGEGPGPRKVTKNDPLFNYSSDAALVSAWPHEFPRLIFTQFVGGNATMARFTKALASGVGGFAVRVEVREVLVQNRRMKDYRIFAERKAKGKTPAARIEMIFDAAIGLPVGIDCTVGSFHQKWLCRWRNHLTFPNKVFEIAK